MNVPYFYYWNCCSFVRAVNDNDGPLRLCLLVVLADLGDGCHNPIVPPDSTLWNDVPVQFFLEKQFRGPVYLLLPIW